MELAEIRNEIDAIDDRLLELFSKRMDLAEQVAAYKAQNALPVLNKERERAILARVTRSAGARERYVHHLFSTLFSLARARQDELLKAGENRVGALVKAALKAPGELFPRSGMVACQGVEGGNSQSACDRILPRGNIVYVKTFEAVFDAVQSGLAQFGVLPIENSTNGSVRAVYDLLQKKNFSVVRMTRLNIRHELLSLPGSTLADIREICSHEQAIGQCGRFLTSLGGAVKVVPCGNTAEAARMVAQSGRKDLAAISSHQCAALYGLTSLKEDIQDSDNNYTRFICIEKDPAIYSGANKISLIITCDNRPGALYEILSKIAAVGVNMTKLESCPVSGSNFEFIFFLELEASVLEPGVLPMLEDLERTSERFILLGNYMEV